MLCGGRVIDPESGTDAVLNVAIIDDKVAAVGPASDVDPADATTTRDCAGCIVCPGFIDLHAHGQNNESARLQACDGVTTHLELEIGTFPVDSFLQQREAIGAVINFGSSAGHIPARAAVMGGKPIPFSVANDPCCMVETKQFSQGHEVDVASAAQMKQIVAALGEGLDQGGIGIGATRTACAQRRCRGGLLPVPTVYARCLPTLHSADTATLGRGPGPHLLLL